MILYIVRHAIAEPWKPGIRDQDRRLSEAGIRKMRQAAAGLCVLGVQPDVIFSSPLVRARQTADILIEILGKPMLQIVPGLAPPSDRAEIYREIRKQEGADAVMLVGHEPSLGAIAAEILSGTPGSCLILKKGSACAIGIARMSPKPSGFLHWLMPPAALRKLG